VRADTIAHSLRGEPLETYACRDAGAVASLGLHKGVAQVYGRGLKGYPAWFMHRVYHLSRVPTVDRKNRVPSGRTLAGLFEREIVSLGSLEHPRAEFERAASGKPSSDLRFHKDRPRAPLDDLRQATPWGTGEDTPENHPENHRGDNPEDNPEDNPNGSS
jgi:hypothetical protein